MSIRVEEYKEPRREDELNEKCKDEKGNEGQHAGRIDPNLERKLYESLLNEIGVAEILYDLENNDLIKDLPLDALRFLVARLKAEYKFGPGYVGKGRLDVRGDLTEKDIKEFFEKYGKPAVRTWAKELEPSDFVKIGEIGKFYKKLRWRRVYYCDEFRYPSYYPALIFQDPREKLVALLILKVAREDGKCGYRDILSFKILRKVEEYTRFPPKEIFRIAEELVKFYERWKSVL